MNERIRELAEQAGFNEMGIWNVIGIEEYHEKFAELIVRECAEFTHPVTRKFIFEHFGVEE